MLSPPPKVDVVYSLYHKKMRSYFNKHCLPHERQMGDDFIQEVLLKYIRSLDTFDTRRPLNPWLYRIMKTVLADMRRDRMQERTNVERHTADPLIIEQHSRDDFDDRVSRLPEVDREILAAIYVDGQSIAEAARKAGTDYWTLYRRVQGALKKVKCA